MAVSRLCSIPDCNKPAAKGRRGFCYPHYKRAWRHGDPLGGGTSPGEPARYLREVVLAYDGDECLIWPYARTLGGYGFLEIEDGTKQYVHRLACAEENGPPPSPKHEAAHKCGRGSCGCATRRHLLWKTPTENRADKLNHGTHNRGERHSLAKLTEPQVRQILALKGKMPQWRIGEMFGVCQTAVGAIHRRRNWGWLD